MADAGFPTRLGNALSEGRGARAGAGKEKTGARCWGEKEPGAAVDSSFSLSLGSLLSFLCEERTAICFWTGHAAQRVDRPHVPKGKGLADVAALPAYILCSPSGVAAPGLEPECLPVRACMLRERQRGKERPDSEARVLQANSHQSSLLRTAATSSARGKGQAKLKAISNALRKQLHGLPAQKKLSPVVVLGYKIDLAIPAFENGFPTTDLAYASIAISAAFEHPSWRYV